MKNNSNIFKTIAVFFAIIIATSMVIMLSVRINEQKDQIEKLYEELAKQNEQVAKLKYELDRPIDDEYIIERAREKLNYHLPNEIIFNNGYSE